MMGKTQGIEIDGKRAIIFSKFLSEEWDLDYLAMFLHFRDSIQKQFNLNFYDVIQYPKWTEGERDILAIKNDTNIDNGITIAEKQIPVILPYSMHFIPLSEAHTAESD